MIARLRQFLLRLRSSFGNKRLDDELGAEVAAHLEFAIEENLHRGMSAEEARRQALVRFGASSRPDSGSVMNEVSLSWMSSGRTRVIPFASCGGTAHLP